MISFITGIDTAVEQALFAARTPVGVKIFSLLTELGGAVAVVIVVIAALIVFWRGKRWAYALGLLVSVSGSLIVAYVVKNLVERARPPLEFHAVLETSYAFPSNHATVAVALYGFLVFAVWKLAPQYRTIVVTLCPVVILAIGFSRLYLGVHYPSDVLAGFILGGIFVWIGSVVTKRLGWIE